jgi:hypothetical protein
MYGDALASLPRAPAAGTRADATRPGSDDRTPLDLKYREYLEARAAWTRKTLALMGSRSP